VEREAPDNGRTRVTRAARGLSTLAIAVSAGVWLASCGGGGGGGTPVTPTATPTPGPVRTVVAQGSYSLSAPEADGTTFFRRTRFETTRVGAFEVTVDWTYASNTVWMYLADGECTADQFASDECPGTSCPCRFVVESEVDVPKPRVLTVPNAAAGVRTLIVWNLGPQEEACTYQAVLISSVAGVGALAHHPDYGGVAGRKRLPPSIRQ
jgi:hypothetical protein